MNEDWTEHATAKKRPATRGEDDEDPAWDAVLKWDPLELSAAAKLAWLTMWKWAGRRPGSVNVNFAELGASQGCTDKVGRNAVRNLIAVHLVERGDRKRGRSTLYLWEPREVCRARDVRVGITDRPIIDQHPDSRDSEDFDCPQTGGTADSLEPIGGTAGGQSAEPPVSPLPYRLSVNQPYPGTHLTLSIKGKGAREEQPAEPPEGNRRNRRTDGAISAEQPFGAVLVDALERRLARDPAAAFADERQVVGYIRQRIPSIDENVGGIVARAILSKRLPRHELEDAIAYGLKIDAEHGSLGQKAWIGFMGVMKRAFREAGLADDWPFGRGPRKDPR